MAVKKEMILLWCSKDEDGLGELLMDFYKIGVNLETRCLDEARDECDCAICPPAGTSPCRRKPLWGIEIPIEMLKLVIALINGSNAKDNGSLYIV